MPRKPLISGNWKMNLTHLEAIQVVQKLSYQLTTQDYEAVDVSVHPPFTGLRTVQLLLDTDRIPMSLGAQNCHWEEKGAYTGEVSPGMLIKLNCAYVIVGHSERREIFGETDAVVRKKMESVVAHGMTPILCVGETLDEREAGSTEAKVTGQIMAALTGRPPAEVAAMVVAYEPIWAIGTGRTATPDDAQSTIGLIRATVRSLFDDDVADALRIQYGGSVKASNAAELHGPTRHRRRPRGWGQPRPGRVRPHRPVPHRRVGSSFVLYLTTWVVLLHVGVSLALILLILLHSGRGGGLSDMFGGAGGSAAAGSTVVERNLDRITVTAAVIFAFTTVILAIRLQ